MRQVRTWVFAFLIAAGLAMTVHSAAPESKPRQKWEYAEWTSMTTSDMSMVSFKSADKKITKTRNGMDVENGAKAAFEFYQAMGGKKDKLYNGAVDIFNLFGDDGWELIWKEESKLPGGMIITTYIFKRPG